MKPLAQVTKVLSATAPPPGTPACCDPQDAAFGVADHEAVEPGSERREVARGLGNAPRDCCGADALQQPAGIIVDIDTPLRQCCLGPSLSRLQLREEQGLGCRDGHGGQRGGPPRAAHVNVQHHGLGRDKCPLMGKKEQPIGSLPLPGSPGRRSRVTCPGRLRPRKRLSLFRPAGRRRCRAERGRTRDRRGPGRRESGGRAGRVRRRPGRAGAGR